MIKNYTKQYIDVIDSHKKTWEQFYKETGIKTKNANYVTAQEMTQFNFWVLKKSFSFDKLKNVKFKKGDF